MAPHLPDNIVLKILELRLDGECEAFLHKLGFWRWMWKRDSLVQEYLSVAISLAAVSTSSLKLVFGAIGQHMKLIEHHQQQLINDSRIFSFANYDEAIPQSDMEEIQSRMTQMQSRLMARFSLVHKRMSLAGRLGTYKRQRHGRKARKGIRAATIPHPTSVHASYDFEQITMKFAAMNVNLSAQVTDANIVTPRLPHEVLLLVLRKALDSSLDDIYYGQKSPFATRLYCKTFFRFATVNTIFLDETFHVIHEANYSLRKRRVLSDHDRETQLASQLDSKFVPEEKRIADAIDTLYSKIDNVYHVSFIDAVHNDFERADREIERCRRRREILGIVSEEEEAWASDILP